MRISKVARETKETKIMVKLNVDGKGVSKIDTPIGFLNHMLESFSKHGFFDLEIKAVGDMECDNHHLIEDIGIVLGQAFDKALGNRAGIKRFADRMIPMDEALCRAVVDISGRPYLVFEGEFGRELVNDLATECVEDFFYSFCLNAKITAHLEILQGRNDHHKIEALFKSFAYAMCKAAEIEARANGQVPSTKGVL
jgi:imidazoleglycerol-phosphate dehydratase